MKSKNDSDKKIEAARAYVASQLDVLRKYGSAENISTRKFNTIVKQVRKATAG